MSARANGRGAIRCLGRAAVVPAAALVVHQLRYLLAFGGNAGMELARQGHSYLHSVVPWIVLSIGLAVGAFLWALGSALRGQRSVPRYTLSLVALWVLCSACLVGIYVAQESLEGLFATGHPGGVAGIFGYGGWWAVPVSMCVGLVLATIFHWRALGARRDRSANDRRARHPVAACDDARPSPRRSPPSALTAG